MGFPASDSPTVVADNPAERLTRTRKSQALCRGRELAPRRRMLLPLIDHVVYGPVRSRRLGRSLGVNLLPAATKACNMNCAYCQYGWTRGRLRAHGQGIAWPSAQAVEAALEARLAAAAAENEIIDRITI